MQIRKSLSLTDVELKFEGEIGKFAGYASKWDGVDSYGDTIVKGAFSETITKSTPKMFFNHQWDMPIGKWNKVIEDENGLFVDGELTKGLSLADDVYAAMKHGTLDGLSIGGYLQKGDYTETKQGRIIHKWTSLMEISPVVFPADSAARIDTSSVKSAIEQLDTLQDFERFLRDAGGFSRESAKTILSRAKELFSLRDAGEETKAKQDKEALALLLMHSKS